MGRLAQIGTRLAPPPDRLKGQGFATRNAERWATRVSRKWYNSARWKALRWDVLVDAMFTCARCKRIEANTSLLVADHMVAHRDDEDLFFNPANLQCLCKACHDSAKQKEERGAGPIPATP